MSFRFPRAPRSSYVPKGAVKVASKLSSAVVYLSSSPVGKPCAVGFYGKADKPAINYSFRDEARRSKYVAEWLRSMDERAAYKAKHVGEKKAALSKPQEFLKLGDVLVCSWGYDQTNIDYYQVLELVGKRGVKICEIGCESIETLSMQGNSVPVVGSFVGKPMLKRVNEYGRVRIASYASASKLEPILIEGKPVGYKPCSADYEYERNPMGRIEQWASKVDGGAWVPVGRNDKGRLVKREGNGLRIGERDEYRDPCF